MHEPFVLISCLHAGRSKRDIAIALRIESLRTQHLLLHFSAFAGVELWIHYSHLRGLYRELDVSPSLVDATRGDGYADLMVVAGKRENSGTVNVNCKRRALRIDGHFSLCGSRCRWKCCQYH